MSLSALLIIEALILPMPPMNRSHSHLDFMIRFLHGESAVRIMVASDSRPQTLVANLRSGARRDSNSADWRDLEMEHPGRGFYQIGRYGHSPHSRRHWAQCHRRSRTTRLEEFSRAGAAAIFL